MCVCMCAYISASTCPCVCMCVSSISILCLSLPSGRLDPVFKGTVVGFIFWSTSLLEFIFLTVSAIFSVSFLSISWNEHLHFNSLCKYSYTLHSNIHVLCIFFFVIFIHVTISTFWMFLSVICFQVQHSWYCHDYCFCIFKLQLFEIFYAVFAHYTLEQAQIVAITFQYFWCRH